MDLVKSILKNMTSVPSLEALTEKAGVSADSIEKALFSAVPSLIGSMTKNASSTKGAQALMGALAQHEDNSDVTSQIANADATDGNKIIGKIMGDDKDDFISSIAKKAGINFDQSNAILSNIAPSLLSSISAAAKPDTEESQAKAAKEKDELADKAEKDTASFLGGFFKKFMKDEDDKDPKGSIDGTDLLDILKKTML